MDWTLIVQVITASAVGLVFIALVVAIILSLRQNARLDVTMHTLLDRNTALLEAAGQQAAAARALAEETHEDRAVASRPLLVLLDEPPVGIREQPWAAVRVRNVGNGPALNFVVWLLADGTLYRSAGAEAKGFAGALHLAPGDIFEPGPYQNMLLVGRAHGYLDPGSAVVGDHPATNLIAFCGDHYGNRYRFNLRTADPPDVWERGADAPAWGGAWDPRLSSGESAQIKVPPRLAALHERDATDLISALRDLLDALHDTGSADADVRLTGRAQRPAESGSRDDFDARSESGPHPLR
jgi:hypothetical protein